MKIAIIGTVGVPARYGGFETLAEQLALGVSSKTHVFTIYCQSSAYKECSMNGRQLFNGHFRIFIPVKANGLFSLFYDFVSMVHALFFERCEALLVLGYSGAWFFPLVRLIKSNTLIVTNIDGMEWRRDKFCKLTKFVLRILEFFAIKFSHRIIIDNSSLMPFLNGYKNLHNLVKIAYGGDHTVVKPVEFNVKLPNIYYLSIARIEPENNCELILKAFSCTPEINLVYIGNWNASRYGSDLKSNYSAMTNITMLDPIYDVHILSTIRNSSIGYVHGHSVGGTNPSLVEALFHTRKVFAYDCQFNRSTLNDCGRYFSDYVQLHMLLVAGETNNISEEDICKLRDSYAWRQIVKDYMGQFNN